LLLAFACNNAQQNVNTSSKQNDNVLIPVIKNEKVGYIDLNGQWVIQPQFQDAQLFNNQGLARVKQNNLWGVIDQTGKTVSEPEQGKKLEKAKIFMMNLVFLKTANTPF